MSRPKPTVLCILDGYGKGDGGAHDAAANANTPCLDSLYANYPYSWINASEGFVGLPGGQMGNSEVGHMNIGAGRVVMQDLPRIDAAIESGALAKNPELVAFIDKLKASGGAAHLLGLLSPGGVHSHQRHIAALANIIAAEGIEVWVHAFLDGRDTPPSSAADYVQTFLDEISHYSSPHRGEVRRGASNAELGEGRPHPSPPPEGEGTIYLATISGRYFGMDRDKRWERVEQGYRAIAAAQGEQASDALAYIQSSYTNKKTDEFIPPAVCNGYDGMKDGDGILMANFRADRARQILTALLDPTFDGFARNGQVKFAAALGMVEYSSKLAKLLPAMFPPESLSAILGEVVSNAGLKQLRIAETEKYAHVTFFFNGGREEVFPGEERVLIDSPKVATYDLKPEMSAPEVTDVLVDVIGKDLFDFIVVNYANTDMVGHSGDMAAAMKAVEAVDGCLARVLEAVLAKDGAMMVTADHGNCEQMHDEQTGQPHTAHTLNLVPAILISNAFKGKKQTAVDEGKLADIAPTMLDFLGLEQPAEMTGTSLLKTVE